MSVHGTAGIRLWLTVAVALAECAHLAWEHAHGGVVSHNILNRADLPAISNWWGLLLLPALAWFLGGLALERIATAPRGSTGGLRMPASVVAGFTGALAMGIALAASFIYGHEAASSFLFASLFVLAVLLPVYRAECLLGFVLGMTFTFGAVLPTVIGATIAAVSAVAHLLVWRTLARLLRRLRQMQAPAGEPPPS